MLNTLQLEIVKEIINIGVGKSAEVLNSMIQSHISLNVPEVKIINFGQINDFVDYFDDDNYSIITLPFNGEISGFSKLIMPSMHAVKLVEAFVGQTGAQMDMDSLKIDKLDYEDYFIPMQKEIADLGVKQSNLEIQKQYYPIRP